MTIRKRGKVWEYRFDIAKVNGKRKQIAKSGFKTKKEAETEGMKAFNYYANGGLLSDYADVSYSDVLDLWFESMKKTWKPNTERIYENIIRLKLKPSLGSYRVRSLSPIKIQEFLNGTYVECSPNYARLIKVVLGASLKYAVVPLGIISSSPCEYIKLPSKPVKVNAKPIQNEDFVRLLEIKEPYRTALLIGYYTGMRIGEVFALTWNDIDLNSKIIKCNKTLSYTAKLWRISTPKTQTSIRNIPIGDSLVKILESYRAEQLKNKVMYGQFYIKNRVKDEIVNEDKGEELDFVLTERWGEFAKPSNMERYCRKYGVKFHSLRHNHATRLIESGVSPRVVQERLGHSSVTITLQTYTHPTEEMQREAVDKFEMLAIRGQNA